MNENRKKQVVWLTNLPAPYRFPIWDRMAESVDLHVVFTLKRKNWRNWPEPGIKKWRYKYLSLNSIQIKEHDFIPSFRGSPKFLRDADCIIVGGWENFVYIRTILLAKRYRIPVIQFYESTNASQRFKRGPVAQIRKWIFQKPNKFFTISQGSLQSLVDMGVNSEKIEVLFNPADVGWFYSFAKGRRTPQSQGHRYIYVGQLIERKNVASVIKAFAAVKNRDDTLTIAGDGPLASELKRLSNSLGIDCVVHFVGHKSQEELAALYSESNTLILASTNEVWGLVINEALASGLHVVVSNKCGVADFVKDMEGTYICATYQGSIQEAMKSSSNSWSGYIQNPEILDYTPERFADLMISKIIIEVRK